MIRRHHPNMFKNLFHFIFCNYLVFGTMTQQITCLKIAQNIEAKRQNQL
jgi:hypothetical protein